VQKGLNMVFEMQKETVTRDSKSALEDLFHHGIKVIIKNKRDKILILKFEKGARNYWDLPGGRVHVDESYEDAGKREVAEETGIKILGSLRYLGSLNSRRRIILTEHQSVGIIYSFYTATTDNDTVMLSDEHVAYIWVDRDELIQYLEAPFGEHFREVMSKIS
jgi:8-oxo-dGTP pyrophosphatase MutT (NUDIX family)